MSKQVYDIILNGTDTGVVKGLSDQIIAKIEQMVDYPILVKISHPLIEFSSDAVNPFLVPDAADALLYAVTQRNKTLTVNSMFRTVVQQHIIKYWQLNGRNGILAAANPGTSNHERAESLDIEEPYDWQLTLEQNSFHKLGDWDPMHFDLWGYPTKVNIPRLQISAFQMLWNANNSKDLIPVDGTYGPVTGARINKSPIDGW